MIFCWCVGRLLLNHCGSQLQEPLCCLNRNGDAFVALKGSKRMFFLVLSYCTRWLGIGGWLFWINKLKSCTSSIDTAVRMGPNKKLHKLRALEMARETFLPRVLFCKAEAIVFFQKKVSHETKIRFLKQSSWVWGITRGRAAGDLLSKYYEQWKSRGSKKHWAWCWSNVVSV